MQRTLLYCYVSLMYDEVESPRSTFSTEQDKDKICIRNPISIKNFHYCIIFLVGFLQYEIHLEIIGYQSGLKK